MNPNLQKLIELQDIDDKIREVAATAQEFPSRISGLEAAVGTAQKAVDAAQAKIDDIATEKRTLIEKVADAKVALTKSQERLNTIRTNREYDAVHAEIEAHKQAAVRAEARLAAVDQDRAKLEEAKTQALAELEKVKNVNEPQIADLKQKVASVDGRVAELTVQRDAVIPQVSRQFLRAYEHIHTRKKHARPISLVTYQERTCATCHKVVESQLVNELRRGVKLILCESCGSILAWDESSMHKKPEEPAAREPD